MLRNDMPVIRQRHMRSKTAASRAGPHHASPTQNVTKGRQLASSLAARQHIGAAAGIAKRTIKHHIKRIETQRITRPDGRIHQILRHLRIVAQVMAGDVQRGEAAEYCGLVPVPNNAAPRRATSMASTDAGKIEKNSEYGSPRLLRWVFPLTLWGRIAKQGKLFRHLPPFKCKKSRTSM